MWVGKLDFLVNLPVSYGCRSDILVISLVNLLKVMSMNNKTKLPIDLFVSSGLES